MEHAEAKSRTGEWFLIAIEDALAARERNPSTVFRCWECEGQVYPHKASAAGFTPAHFEHRHAHNGCSLIERTFCGIKRYHPLMIG